MVVLEDSIHRIVIRPSGMTNVQICIVLSHLFVVSSVSESHFTLALVYAFK